MQKSPQPPIESVDLDQLLIAGDWHSNVAWACAIVNLAAEAGIRVILHVGDFGIWQGDSGDKYLKDLQKTCEKTGVVIYFIDGNHENFEKLYGYKLVEDGTRKVSDNIFHLPRGFRWTWKGQTWLALGGAHSVDRPNRIPGISWWAQETLTAGEINTAIDGGPADFMVTHDCPAGVDIPVLKTNGFKFQEEELRLAYQHRKSLEEVVKVVKPEVIFHGHYHDRYNGTYVHEDSLETTIVGLNCDGTRADSNVVIIPIPFNKG